MLPERLSKAGVFGFFLLLLVFSLSFVSPVRAGDAPQWGTSCSSNPPGEPPALTDLVCVIFRIVGALFTVIGGVAGIAIILAGIRFATAGGDEKAVAQAKKAITYAVLGMLIAWGAVFIVDMIGGLLGFPGNLSRIVFPSP